MIDASHHSLEENIAITKSVVEYAHARGRRLPPGASAPDPRPSAWRCWNCRTVRFAFSLPCS